MRQLFTCTTGLAAQLRVMACIAAGLIAPVLQASEQPAEAPAPLLLEAPPALRQQITAPPAEAAESLPALMLRVLRVDPQVRTAQALWQVAQQRRQQALSRLGPSIFVQAVAGQGAETEFGRAIDRRTDRAEAGLRWNLYNSGNDQAELQASERELAAAAQELRRAREDTTERLAETYVGLLHVQAQLPMAAERLSMVRQLAERVQRQN